MKTASVSIGSPLLALATLRGQRWGTVVHVGAGPAAVAVLARRLLVFDGDPASCAQLRAATRGRADVSIREQVIAPVDGPVVWHQHNWHAADGLQDLSAVLADIYPRLRLLDRREVEARALAEVVEDAEIQRAGDGGEVNALVLDVPSGADAMIQALAPELVMGFDWIVAGGLPDDGPETTTPAYLRPQAWAGSPGRLTWRVWQVDHAARRTSLELARTREELGAVQLHLEATRRQGGELAQQLARQTAHLEGREREWATTLAEQVTRLGAQDQELVSRLGEIEGLQQRLQAVTRAEAKLDLIAELLLAERLR